MAPASPADDRIIETSGPPCGAARRVLRAVLIACAAGAIFGSSPLLDAARALPDSAWATALQSAAAHWDGAMAGVGAAQPYALLRAGIRFLQAWNAPS